MYSLRVVSVGDKTLLLETDGRVNAPLSLFVNAKFSNPHSREACTAGLRILHRFLNIHNIDLAKRALSGECLRSVERDWLGNLAYRPLNEISAISCKLLKKISMAANSKNPKKIAGAVHPNTAASRMETVAQFLNWFFSNILAESIRSRLDRETLSRAYAETTRELGLQIGRTKQGHQNQFNSLPSPKYLEIVEEVFLNYEQLLRTENGKGKRTVLRDRAIVLLAAEGIRPGAIANLTVHDFYFNHARDSAYLTIRDNLSKRSEVVKASTPRAKGVDNPSYNSNITIKLWSFTSAAILEYINSERQEALGRGLKNKSRSFLFLTVSALPISDRSTLALIFNSLGERLRSLGKLSVARDDPYVQGKFYDFTAYTLRHSAASFFYERFRDDPGVNDLMGLRFGWTKNSKMPLRYANRARSEAAAVDMDEFYRSLQSKLDQKRNGASGEKS